ncbi:hypothetical protein ACFL1A_02150 [Patescibacteria group bacterium]
MKKLTNILNIVELMLLPLSLLVALFSFFLFDDPNENRLSIYIVFSLMVTSPIVLLTTLLLSRKWYKVGSYKKSFWVSFIPVFSCLLFGFFVFGLSRL